MKVLKKAVVKPFLVKQMQNILAIADLIFLK